MILALLSYVKTSQYTPETQQALKAWKNTCENDKAYNAKVNNYLNRSGQGKPSSADLKNRLREIIRGTISPQNIKENKEVLKMNKKDIKHLVAEVLNENSGMGYAKYPYRLNEPSEEEADQDYMVEWRALVDEICDNSKRNYDGDPNTSEDMAIEVAKILVKDSDLFRDVLELAGNNKSVGVQIMQQLKTAMEK